MAIPSTAVAALMKATQPGLRSPASKVAFATHSYAVAAGCTLVGTGASVPCGNPDTAVESSLEGWDADESCYQFQYRTPASQGLVIKCLPLGDKVLVHWSSGEEGADIMSVDIDLGKHTQPGSTVTDGYKDLDGLLSTIAPGLHSQIQQTGTPSKQEPAGAAPAVGEPARRDGPPDNRDIAMGVPVFPGPDAHRVGLDDLYPADVVPGSTHPAPIPPGLGGSQVGPGHPMFGGGVRSDPRFTGGRGSLPPGARWDPIGPEGVPGFHPDDFTPGGDARLDGWHDVGPPPGRHGVPGSPDTLGMPDPGPMGRRPRHGHGAGGPGFGGPGMGGPGFGGGSGGFFS